MYRNNVNGFGNDNYCKILLAGHPLATQSDDEIGPAEFMESSKGGRHAATLYSDTFTYPLKNTAVKRFNDYSWHFPDTRGEMGILVGKGLHADWNLKDSDFTIDYWESNSGGFGTPAMFVNGCYIDEDNYWGARYTITGVPNVMNFHFKIVLKGTTVLDVNYQPSTTAYTFNHYAIVKYDGNVKLYLNGEVQASAPLTSMPTIASSYRVGTFCGGGCSDPRFYIDEFRFSKGIARWTKDFTPPNRMY